MEVPDDEGNKSAQDDAPMSKDDGADCTVREVDDSTKERQWQVEKAKLMDIIRTQRRDARQLAKRFNMLQQTLHAQQRVLDRYQQALLQQKPSLLSEEPCAAGKKACLVIPSSPSSAGQDRGLPSPPRSRTRPRQTACSAVSSRSLVSGTQSSADARKTPIPKRVLLRNADTDVPMVKKRTLGAEKESPGARKAHSAKLQTSRSSPKHAGRSARTERQAVSADPVKESAQAIPEPRPRRLSNVRELPSALNDEKENNNPAFKYVEVVRKRAERAALPGHDCVECRKYYDALDGLIPDIELERTKCSRHRARFEPYQTPDDFWRLSFPDSDRDE